MGATEFIMGIAMKNEKIHKLLNIVNDFIIDWLFYQKEIFPSIEGILILDDIVGFIGESDFKEYALPYLKNIFNSFNAQVNLFHNDSKGLVCSPYLKDIGIDIFNFSYEHSINEIKELTDNKIILLGNIPPVDILAQSSEEDIHKCVKNTFQDITDCSGIIWSCGGGMPPDVSTENINAFVKAVRGMGNVKRES